MDAPQYGKRSAPPPPRRHPEDISQYLYTRVVFHIISVKEQQRAAYIWLRSSLKIHFNKMKYAVVYWTATNETSCFGRQLLLCSRCQHALIQIQEERNDILQTARGKEGPERRWKAYKACVVSVHGKLLYYIIKL